MIGGLFIFFGGIFWGDMASPYKRIGKTNFYLVKEGDERSYLMYNENNSFHGVNSWQVYEIHWNDKFVLLKCHKGSLLQISKEKVYYIIQYNESLNSDMPWKKHEYHNKEEYERAKSFFGINENDMYVTNIDIPWSLHIFD